MRMALNGEERVRELCDLCRHDIREVFAPAGPAGNPSRKLWKLHTRRLVLKCMRMDVGGCVMSFPTITRALGMRAHSTLVEMNHAEYIVDLLPAWAWPMHLLARSGQMTHQQWAQAMLPPPRTSYNYVGSVTMEAVS